MKRVLLIGGSGSARDGDSQRAGSDCEIVRAAAGELAIEQTRSVRAAIDRLRSRRPRQLRAAFHDVDRCEAEPERAFAINALAVGAAAAPRPRCGAVFVTISTDYVFDGETRRPYAESDRAASRSRRTALEARRRASSSNRPAPRAFVVRTCGLYGASSSPERAVRSSSAFSRTRRAGEPMRVVADVVASPTYRRRSRRRAPRGSSRPMPTGSITRPVPGP